MINLRMRNFSMHRPATDFLIQPLGVAFFSRRQRHGVVFHRFIEPHIIGRKPRGAADLIAGETRSPQPRSKLLLYYQTSQFLVVT